MPKISDKNVVAFAKLIAKPDIKHIELCHEYRSEIVSFGLETPLLAVTELVRQSKQSVDDCTKAIDFLLVVEFIASLARVWNEADEKKVAPVTFSCFVREAAPLSDKFGYRVPLLVGKFYATCIDEMDRAIMNAVHA